MREILLRNGGVVIVDDADYEPMSRFSWNLSSGGYAQHCLCDGPVRLTLLMNRLIVQPDEGLEVDHINRNRLDNRRCNLRAVTHAVNTKNNSLSKRNKSGFRGVSLDKPSGRWKASISKGGKQFHLGYFDNKADAARAYDREAFLAGINPELLNFPELIAA
jgi:hypothetical protein